MRSGLVTQDGISEVSSLLIPLHEKQLILPNVTVAEIIPYRMPKIISNHTSWLLGQLEWRNIHIPVLSYEALSGSPVLAFLCHFNPRHSKAYTRKRR
jgi:chemosensory pili system protein ChpC